MHHANLKRIHWDSWEAKSCCVENDTETVNIMLLSPVRVGLVHVFMQSF